jgi:hypothetical protein
MKKKDTEVMHIQMSPEAVQMGFAQVLSEQLNISGHDDIDALDILDCMAIANCHFEFGGEISSKAYFGLLEIERICDES